MGCHAMWEWLINNHPVNTTISSLLQLNINGDKGIGLAILTQWNCWIVGELTYCLVISCVHPCTPLYSWINLSRSILFFFRDPPSNCSKNGTPLLFQWWPCGRVSPWVGGTVLLRWTHPQTRGYLLLPQHATLLAEHCWKAGGFPVPGSRRQIINRFMLSALIMQPTLVVDWPIKQTTSHLLIWAGQISFHGIKLLSSLENWNSLVSRSGAFCSWCKSWSHFCNRNQMSMIDCSPSIIPKI